MYICIGTYAYTCITHAHRHTHTHNMYVRMCIYIYVFICVKMYMYTHISIYIYLHTHILCTESISLLYISSRSPDGRWLWNLSGLPDPVPELRGVGGPRKRLQAASGLELAYSSPCAASGVAAIHGIHHQDRPITSHESTPELCPNAEV